MNIVANPQECCVIGNSCMVPVRAAGVAPGKAIDCGQSFDKSACVELVGARVLASTERFAPVGDAWVC